ncbi:MAG: MarR family winged helix-turn-helix transcriptional regulator [Sneathiella sp.]
MNKQDLLIYSSITDLLVAIQDNRLRFDALRQPVQWEIAFHIEQAELTNNSIDISGISALTNHSRNTIKKQVSALTEAGYVTTVTDPNDNRRKILRSTEKLRSELEKFAKSLSPTITRASYEIQNRIWADPAEDSN